jgi:hypothetical protein
MSKLTPLLMVIALVVGIAGWQATKPPSGAHTEIKAVDGTLSLSNSKDGAAVLTASNLAPGQSAGGVVVLANTGTLSGALDLSQTDLTDTLGASGGQLSQALHLTVRDVVSNAVVYDGPLSGLTKTDLGTMAPGETRSYSFTASLPSSADNSYAAASVNAKYVWNLADASGGGGNNGGGNNGGGNGGGSNGGGSSSGGGGGSAGGGGGAGSGSGSGSGAGSGLLVSKMKVSLKINAKKALKSGRIDVTVKCGEPCKLRSYAQLRKRKLKTRRKSASVKVANKKVKIKLVLPKKAKANLKKTLAKKKKDYIVVYVTATDVRGGKVNLKKQIRVKVAKKKRR